MIQSMTGFGKAVEECNHKKITVEIRSLNSKNIDINARIPYLYREKELEIRKLISESLHRGKIDAFVQTESTEGEKSQELNTEVIQSYIRELKTIAPDLKEADLLSTIIQLPDVLTYTEDEASEEEWEFLKTAFEKAIEGLINFRKSEGEILAKDFVKRIQKILELLTQVEPYEEERIEILRERFTKNLEELNTEYDKNRFEQELIYYIEKLDVTEEKVRLKNHCEYFIETLNTPKSNGKKLNFICQEIGREINTLGSKANHSEMQKIVVQMKDELEKIKEQILNIL